MASVDVPVSPNLGPLAGMGEATTYIEAGLAPNTRYERFAGAFDVDVSSFGSPVAIAPYLERRAQSNTYELYREIVNEVRQRIEQLIEEG